jgi:uncharacterized protein
MTLAILERGGTRAFQPRISRLSRPFWDALADGVFLLSNCGDCARLAFPPRSFCPACGSANIGWQAAQGTGKLYSLTTVHAGPPQLMGDGPYAGAIIDLTEGVRLVTQWLGPRDVLLDTPVELVVTRYQDGCLFAARSALG